MTLLENVSEQGILILKYYNILALLNYKAAVTIWTRSAEL